MQENSKMTTKQKAKPDTTQKKQQKTSNQSTNKALKKALKKSTIVDVPVEQSETLPQKDKQKYTQQLSDEQYKTYNDYKTTHHINTNYKKLVYHPEKLQKYIFTNKASKLSVQYYRDFWLTNIRRHATLLIRMKLRNGKTTEFFIANDLPFFLYMKGTYIIDSNMVHEDIPSGYMCLQYHQDCALPVSMTVDVEKVKDAVPEDVALNVNPQILQDTVEAQVVKATMAGGILDKQIQKMVIFLIVLLVMMGINILAMLINFIA